MIRRPDKEDNIRIEAMSEAPQAQAPQEKRSYPPRREAGAVERGPRQNDGPRHEHGPQNHTASRHGEQGLPGPGFDKKQQYQDKPAYAGKPHYDKGSADGKPVRKEAEEAGLIAPRSPG